MSITTCAPNEIRPKYEKPKAWAVLTDSEKIERLRDIIKQKTYFENKVYQLENKISKLRTLLANHSHNEHGAVSRISEYDHDNLGGDCVDSSLKEDPSEAYF